MTNELAGPRLLLVRLVNGIGKPFGINPIPRSFANGSVGEPHDRSSVFDGIYQGNAWGSEESRSGVGSEREFAGRYLERLRLCLLDRRLKVIFDAPCGDLNWIMSLVRDENFTYFGGDISKRLISHLSAIYPDVDLRVFDICEDRFPEADVWHCRDCLFHLPFSDIYRALENFVSSKIPFALITTHKARLHRNLDVPLGGFRYIDLERSPIALPRAEVYLPDFRIGRDFPRFVGLWSREAVADAMLRRRPR